MARWVSRVLAGVAAAAVAVAAATVVEEGWAAVGVGGWAAGEGWVGTAAVMPSSIGSRTGLLKCSTSCQG